MGESSARLRDVAAARGNVALLLFRAGRGRRCEAFVCLRHMSLRLCQRQGCAFAAGAMFYPPASVFRRTMDGIRRTARGSVQALAVRALGVQRTAPTR